MTLHVSEPRIQCVWMVPYLNLNSCNLKSCIIFSGLYINKKHFAVIEWSYDLSWLDNIIDYLIYHFCYVLLTTCTMVVEPKSVFYQFYAHFLKLAYVIRNVDNLPFINLPCKGRIKNSIKPVWSRLMIYLLKWHAWKFANEWY